MTPVPSRSKIVGVTREAQAATFQFLVERGGGEKRVRFNCYIFNQISKFDHKVVSKASLLGIRFRWVAECIVYDSRAVDHAVLRGMEVAVYP